MNTVAVTGEGSHNTEMLPTRDTPLATAREAESRRQSSFTAATLAAASMLENEAAATKDSGWGTSDERL